MTPIEFDRVFEPMLKTYGEKNYPDVRYNMIFNLVRVLKPEVASSVFETIIARERYAPMLDTIKEYFKEPLLATQSKDYDDGSPACFKCKGEGVILKDQKYGYAQVASRCPCSAGTRKYSGLPLDNGRGF